MASKTYGILTLIQTLLTDSLSAYSESGHRIVGAFAEMRIEGKRAAAAINKLLGGVSLERASTLPDELRG